VFVSGVSVGIKRLFIGVMAWFEVFSSRIWAIAWLLLYISWYLQYKAEPHIPIDKADWSSTQQVHGDTVPHPVPLQRTRAHHPAPIPGLTVSVARAKSAEKQDVVSNGLSAREYHAIGDINELHVFPSEEPSLTFFIQRNNLATSATDFRLGMATIERSMNDVETELSGPASVGETTITATTDSYVTISFYCRSVGVALIQLSIPLLAWDDHSRPPRPEPLVFRFKKQCHKDSRMGVFVLKDGSNQVGLGIPGFSVGLAKDTHDVVKHGIPGPLYLHDHAGALSKDSVIVGPEVASIRLFIHLSAAAAKRSVRFESPWVISHDSKSAASLSGSGAGVSGGTVQRGGDNLELDFYNGNVRHPPHVGSSVETLLSCETSPRVCG
jgi:hypothetical protein